MAQNIVIPYYLGSVTSLIEANANKEGTLVEKLAWYIDGLYSGGIAVHINNVPVGLHRAEEIPTSNFWEMSVINAGVGLGEITLSLSGDVEISSTGNVFITKDALDNNFITQQLTLSPTAKGYSIFKVRASGKGSIVVSQADRVIGLGYIPTEFYAEDKAQDIKSFYNYIDYIPPTLQIDTLPKNTATLYLKDIQTSLYAKIEDLPLTQLSVEISENLNLVGSLVGKSITYLSIDVRKEGVLPEFTGTLTNLPLRYLKLKDIQTFGGDISNASLIYLELDNAGNSIEAIENIFSATESIRKVSIKNNTDFVGGYVNLFKHAPEYMWDIEFSEIEFTVLSGTDPGYANVSNYIDDLLNQGVPVNVSQDWIGFH